MSESDAHRGGRLVRSGGFLLTFGLVLQSGCGSSEPEPAAPQNASAPADTGSPAAPRPPLSPAAQEAAATFRKMTSEGVSPEEWESAREKLLEIGSDAILVLADGLRDSSAIRRETAATLLAWFGAEAHEAAPALKHALSDPSEFVRANAATALVQMEEHAADVVPVLGAFLESDDPALRTMAATNLAVIAPDRAAPILNQLIRALDDSEPGVVLAVVELLGRMGPSARDALPKLRALNVSREESLRLAVTAALLQIEGQGETPAP
jgi:hypothetical protein